MTDSTPPTVSIPTPAPRAQPPEAPKAKRSGGIEATVTVLLALAISGIAATAAIRWSESAAKAPIAKGGAGSSASAGDPAHGKNLFGMSCFVCHGPTGAGVPGLGAPLRTSKFVASKTDDQLITFVKTGRQPFDKDSVLHLTMPPKGGNPALDDKSIHDIIAYIRVLQDDERKVHSANAVSASASVGTALP